MKLVRLISALAVFALAFGLLSFTPRGATVSSVAFASPKQGGGGTNCVPVNGTFSTNMASIGEMTTLGSVTGDLKGAVAATILSINAGPTAGTTQFHVQHHIVTEAGDAIYASPAIATVIGVTKTLFAIVTYPVTIIGGTGKYAGATGSLTNIGEVDVPNFPSFSGGRVILRYTGQVCYPN